MPGRRVLVVDDDADIVVYLAHLLEDRGHQVETASSAASALHALESFTADAVVMDVLMPGRSGLDLLVRLRRDPRWSDLTVVVITGSDRVVEDGGRSYISLHNGIRGADAVLGKPVDPEQLFAIIEA